jgi:hypothetical protein
MEKGKDYYQNFTPTPGIAIACNITSIAAANDLELHSIGVEQASLQADKLLEGVNGRDLYTEIPRRQEPYKKLCVSSRA